MADAPTLEQYIEQRLVPVGKLKNTPANRKKLTDEWNNKYRGGNSDNWRTYFKIQFPQFVDLIDGGAGEAQARSVFGDDLIDLFLDAAKNPDNYDFTTDTGMQAWDNKVKATKFYQNLLPKQRQWDLTPNLQKEEQIKVEIQRIFNDYGNLKLTEDEARNFAIYNLRNQASDLQQKYYGFSLVGDRTPSAVAALPDANQIKQTLKAYGYQPRDLDAQVQSILTGKKYNGAVLTEDSLLETAKNNAKILYPHWSAQIDKGSSLDDIFGTYATLISKTLEINPNTITKEMPLFNDILDMTDKDGKPISGTELTYKLKSMPKYKYGRTQQANDEVRELIQSLQTDFGIYK